MQTHFSAKALADSDNAASEQILRRCVHCGFCTATCPTYLLRGDELDSPRGRIYLIKDMLEKGRAADMKTVTHIDRCLSCLSCMTTCPSGVNYMHLVDHARTHIEKTYQRPLAERGLRNLLAFVLPRPALFRFSLRAANLAKPLKGLMPQKLATMLDMAPQKIPAPSAMDRPQVHLATGERQQRVALMTGCAQKVLDPTINDATIRLLTRHGIEVVIADRTGCCGALTHHMGKTGEAHKSALANIRAWKAELEEQGLDAIIINASGCGTTVKDYGFMFRNDPENAKDARLISSLTFDISEFLTKIKLKQTGQAPALKIAYQSACSLQHGQKITMQPMDLLRNAGFDVVTIPESHICCGSAGTYNLLQPELANELRARKVANIDKVAPMAIASGNIGCMMQLRNGTTTPVVHTVELLDWATGGPKPPAIRDDTLNFAQLR